jgi:hypothetical protein
MYKGMIVTFLEQAHDATRNNEATIALSDQVGCFYCGRVYKATKIKEWTDAKTTALCWKCGIDSVIPDASGYPLHPVFLKLMELYWFGR